MGKINKKALIISLLLTVVCAVLLYRYVNTLQAPVTEKAKTSVFVSVRDIEPGDIVLPADIKEMQVSIDSVPSGIITDRKGIENMLASERILAGEPFRTERLATVETMGLSWSLPEGKRAISVFVSESTLVGNLIRVGDHVDFISSFKASSEEVSYKQSTYTTVQNIEVLAIGQDRYKTGDDPTSLSGKGVDDLARTITLMVDPEQAEVITYAITYGEFTLVMRPQGDDLEQETKGVIMEEVVPEIAVSTDMILDGTVVGE